MDFVFQHIFLFAVLLIFASFILPLVRSFFLRGPQKFRKRAQFISDYARQKGYQLANPAVAEMAGRASLREMLTNPALRTFTRGSEGITDIGDFARGTDDPFAMVCSLRGKEATVFGFSVSSQRADTSGGTIRYKVAKIRSDGLPRFSLGRNSLVHTVESAVDKFTGKPASNIEMDPGGDSEFAKHYWVRGEDNGAIRVFLSPEKMRFLGGTKLTGTIATNANYFVYSEYGALNSVGDFDSFIATVESLVAHLL